MNAPASAISPPIAHAPKTSVPERCARGIALDDPNVFAAKGLAASGAIRLWAADTPALKRKSASPTNPDPPELKGYKTAVRSSRRFSTMRTWTAQRFSMAILSAA